MTEIRCAIELREDSARESPGRLTGVLLELGRVAGDRREGLHAGIGPVAGGTGSACWQSIAAGW